MAKKKKPLSYAAWQKQRKKEAAAAADRIRPLLEKDPKWPLATKDDASDLGSYGDRLKAVTHITKRVVRLLRPDVQCSVRRGRGTAYGWVYVCITAPKLEGPRCMERDSARTLTKSLIGGTLRALGIKYGTYLPDCLPGRDEPSACLSIEINGYM